MKPSRPSLVFFVVFASVLLVAGVFHEYFNPLLEFNRQAIEAGQWWRMFTGNLVHLNLAHLALNMSGLVLLYYFFYDVMLLRVWLVALAVGITGTGLCLYYLNPGLRAYVGLSGVLHGIFLVALVLSFRQTPKLNSIIILLVLGRLAWEQTPDYDVNYMREYIKGSVFVDAHLYGAMFGLVSAALLLLERKSREGKPEAT